jgi:hypothetical protein
MKQATNPVPGEEGVSYASISTFPSGGSVACRRGAHRPPLDAEQVRRPRRLHAAGLKIVALAGLFDVSPALLRKVLGRAERRAKGLPARDLCVKML